MKYTIFMLLMILGLSTYAQQAYNTSCGSALFISSNPTAYSVNYQEQIGCQQGNSVDLYYYYRAGNSAASSNILSLSPTQGGSGVNFTYQVYGPFNSQAQGCTALGTNPTPLVSGNQTTPTVSHALTNGQYYVLKVSVQSCTANVLLSVLSANLNAQYADQECLTCVKMFYPSAGNYVVSAWVKDASASASAINLDKPAVIVFSGANSTTLTPKGQIIEGWQRIEEIVYLDDAALQTMYLRLKCNTGGDCYFDDIRIHPVDGSMIAYVYDPLTLRLVAEMDERNYAKLYEYDEQGKLVRIKKETEKGIMTIQETRENNAGNYE